MQRRVILRLTQMHRAIQSIICQIWGSFLLNTWCQLSVGRHGVHDKLLTTSEAILVVIHI